MLWWALAATAAAAVLLFLFLNYRRQIVALCRKLRFVQQHKTNLRLESQTPYPALNRLIDDIDQILLQSQHTRRISHLSEEALKETITNLSHDIRTPLTSLDGYFQLLSQSEDEQERQQYLAVIQSRITSLKEMLEELFTYTKLQNESYRLPSQPVDFSRCVYDVLFSFYGDFKARGFEPETDICEQRLVALANEEAVRRVLQNIVKNALEHGKSAISFSLAPKGDTAVFCCGNDLLSPEEVDIHKVFSRFYKADAARTHSSTGLGLSIAKELTEKMSGSIEASLSQNIFTIRLVLPLAPGQEHFSPEQIS